MSDLDEDGSLTTDAGNRVNQLRCTPIMFMDKSIVMYGPSKSGKTVLVKYIMSMLNGHIEQVIVVSPTEPVNKSYRGYVPPPCVHVTPYLADGTSGAKRPSGPKAVLAFLESVWKRQEMLASIYQRVNDPQVLATLFRRLPRAARAEGLAVIDSLNTRRKRVIDRIRDQWRDDPGRRDSKVKDVNDKFSSMLQLLYKKYLLPERDRLWLEEGLTEDERFSLAYLQLNPRLLLILDDCAAELKSVFNQDIFRKLFYQNRHSFITLVLCCQDDTDLPTNLRKNAFISFFTEPIVCSANFNRTSNQFSKPTKEYVADILPALFKGNRKLAYIREDDARQHFYHVTPPWPRPFRFGSEALWELCETVKNDGRALDESNPYYARFAVGK